LAEREQAQPKQFRREEPARQPAEREPIRREPPVRNRVRQPGAYSVTPWQPPQSSDGGSDTLQRIHTILDNARPNYRAYEQRQRQQPQTSPASSYPEQNLNKLLQQIQRQQELQLQQSLRGRSQ